MTIDDAFAQISIIAQTWHDHFLTNRVLKRTLKLQGEHIITAVRQSLIIADTPANHDDLVTLQQTLEALTAVVALRAHPDETPIPAWRVRGHVQTAFAAPPVSISLIVFAQTAESAVEHALDEVQRRYRGQTIEITTWEDDPIAEKIEGKQTHAD